MLSYFSLVETEFIRCRFLRLEESYHFRHGERCSHISHGVETGFIRCRFLRLGWRPLMSETRLVVITRLDSQGWIYEDVLTIGFPTWILTTGSEMGSQMLDPRN